MTLIVEIRDALVFKDLRQFGDISKRLTSVNAVIMEVPDDTDLKAMRKVDGVKSVRQERKVTLR